MSFFPN